MANHIDVPQAAIRESRKQGRNTKPVVKFSRVHLDESGEPTGKVTLMDGRKSSLGSFTLGEDGTVKVHKAAEKRQPKAADEAAAE